MAASKESPLDMTPAASWAPGSGANSGGGMEVRRSSSTLARLTRSVSKLGSSKASRARQAAAAAAASGSGSSALPFRRISSAATLGAAAGVGGGQAPSQEPAAAARQGGRGRDPLGGAATLAARIQLFEQGRFNLDSELGALTEKGVERLRGELGGLEGEVASQLRAAVHEHYSEFVKATPGILRLEGEVQQLHALVHNMGDVVEGLKEAATAVAQSQRQAGSGGAGAGGGSAAQQAAVDAEAAWRQGSDGAKWGEGLDDADVAVAERRVPAALALLRRLESLLQRFVAAADAGDPEAQARVDGLQAELEARRERLAATAEQQVLQPIATAADIRAGAALLLQVAGAQHAHSVVLEAHAAKLRARQAALLRPANSGGGDADGADYAAALGQKLALGLAAAIEDCDAVFGRGASSGGGGGGSGDEGGGASLRAAFLVWALHQTERACHLLRKHALLPFAAPAGLHAFGRCAFAFAAHAAALEASHGLQLVPTVQRELWPVLEQVLARRMRKLGEALRRAVLAEVDQLSGGGVAPPTDLSSWDALAAAYPSADFLLDELEGTAVEGRRLACPRFAAALRRATTDLFQLYTASLAGALNRHLRAPGTSNEAKERLAAAAEGGMELSTLLLERFVPEALQPLSEVCGEVCDVQAMSEQLARVGEALGMTVAPLTPGASAALNTTAAAAAAAPVDGGSGSQPAAEEMASEEEEQQQQQRRRSTTEGSEDVLTAAAAGAT